MKKQKKIEKEAEEKQQQTQSKQEILFTRSEPYYQKFVSICTDALELYSQYPEKFSRQVLSLLWIEKSKGWKKLLRHEKVIICYLEALKLRPQPEYWSWMGNEYNSLAKNEYLIAQQMLTVCRKNKTIPNYSKLIDHYKQAISFYEQAVVIFQQGIEYINKYGLSDKEKLLNKIELTYREMDNYDVEKQAIEFDRKIQEDRLAPFEQKYANFKNLIEQNQYIAILNHL